MKLKNEQIIGNRTILKVDFEIRSGSKYSLVVCKCGKQDVVSNSALKQGRALSCRKCHGQDSCTKFETGTKIGNWEVITPNEKSNNGRYLTRVRCNCGFESLIRNAYLNSERTNSCEGCRARKVSHLLTNTNPWSSELNTISLHSKRRNLECSLTVDDVEKLSSANCTVCGACPNMKSRSGVKLLRGVLRNSIDRIDSSKGYTLNNCQTLCWNCNRWKGKLSQSEFLETIDKLVKFQNSRCPQ